MFAMFKHFHKLHNGLVLFVQVLFAFYQLVFALREVHKLVQSLLVDMTVVLEFGITFL